MDSGIFGQNDLWDGSSIPCAYILKKSKVDPHIMNEWHMYTYSTLRRYAVLRYTYIVKCINVH